MFNDKWNRRFLERAALTATWSKDPSTKVGAVIVRPNRTEVSSGYNGFPRGFPDFDLDYANRQFKYSMIVHAELNAILSANENLAGCHLYTWPLPPCVECMKAIVQKGIVSFVSVAPTEEQYERWKESFDNAQKVARYCGIKFSFYDKDGNHIPRYWENTLPTGWTMGTASGRDYRKT